MRQLFFSILFLFLTVSLFAQPTFDVGIKAGVNKSKLVTSFSEFKEEPTTKMHVGAFGRVGWERVFIQPEAYFSAKGGDLNSGLFNTVSSFDFNTVDVPVLFGVKVIKGGLVNVRAMAGPVFSFLTTNKVKGDDRFTVQDFKDAYYGYQYGIGADVGAFTLDLRMDHGSSNIYSHPDLRSRNRSFMVSLGFKIL